MPPEQMYPAGEAGIVVRRVPIRDGVTLRVLEAGPPSSTAVVLVHGWAGSVYSFAETIPALATAGHRVIAIDLPGHGLSDKPRAHAWYSVPAMTDAVAAVIASLGVTRYAIVAHSMAGAIALALSERGPIRPYAVALIGAVGVGRVPLAVVARLITPDSFAGLIPPFINRTVVRLVAGIAFGTRGRPTERDVDEYWAPTQFDGFAVALSACLHRANWHRESREVLGAFRLPTLVIAGGRDRVVQGVARGGSYIPGAKVVVVPEAGHLVMQDCASQVNALLLDFLRPTNSG
jgi:pyruvate dehydrogenase E2 component (dihydrolipoamide acetyltransferase)